MKYLAVSQIVYMLSSLPPHLKIVQEINSSVWDSKGGKIKRTELLMTMIKAYTY